GDRLVDAKSRGKRLAPALARRRRLGELERLPLRRTALERDARLVDAHARGRLRLGRPATVKQGGGDDGDAGDGRGGDEAGNARSHVGGRDGAGRSGDGHGFPGGATGFNPSTR